MKKVLIWDYFPLKNIGGPAGYSYNIHEYLKVYPNERIKFLSDLVREKGKAVEFDYPCLKLHTRKTYIGQLWNQIIKAYFHCFKPFLTRPKDIPVDLDINQYDFVHIHMSPHVSQFKRLYPNYTGKIILTTHCPCTCTEENMEHAASGKSKLNKVLQWLKPILLSMEGNAFKEAAYIMFPCVGAREPYEKEPMIKKVFDECRNKFFYVPTSIVDYKPDLSTCQKLSEFGIPQDAFVISYFGRHISVKGYDILVKIGARLLEENPNLYFLCAGNGSIEAPKHPRWIELGFIKNVDDLIPQSDLYILPNRETYFDLITLQILRAGVPLILSDTGGNKYFKDLPRSETKGLDFFNIEDEDSLLELVQDAINLYSSNHAKYESKRVSNRNLYEKYFTIDRYVKEYTGFIDK